MLNELDNNLNKLLEWIENNGFEGWDPYDIQGSRFYTKYLMKNNKFTFVILQKIFRKISFYFPILMRVILGLKPKKNAKAMALLALSYIKLYKLSNNKKYYKKYQEIILWLMDNNHSKNKDTLGWGYPFDWHSLIFIPKETPLCVPTVLVGHALLDEWEITRNEENIEAIHKIMNFLTTSLNITTIDKENICFSYSPIDDYMVINANLYTASFLTRYGISFKNDTILEQARKARNFAINQQEKDGSWPYWSKLYKSKMPIFVDNYHTGIKLQWLKMCHNIDPIANEKEAIEKGTEYYYNNLFSQDGIPKYRDKVIYPVDIHGPAQAFITFNFLSNSTNLDLVNKVYNFVIKNMKSKEGYYYYQIDKYGYTSKISYLRWAQAWMLLGLINLKEIKEKKQCVG